MTWGARWAVLTVVGDMAWATCRGQASRMLETAIVLVMACARMPADGMAAPMRPWDMLRRIATAMEIDQHVWQVCYGTTEDDTMGDGSPGATDGTRHPQYDQPRGRRDPA